MMKRTVFNNFKIGSSTVRFITYESVTPSNNWLIFLPGRGETGTDVTAVERPTAPARLAKDGRDFNFNIIAGQSTGDYSIWLNAVVPWLKTEKKATKIGMTGLSLGGQWTYLTSIKFQNLPIDFIAPIAGLPDNTIKPICGFKDTPVYVVNGDKDTINNFSVNKTFADQIKACIDRKSIYTFVPVVNGGHDVWSQTYSQPDSGPFWTFVNKQFTSAIPGPVATKYPGTVEVIEIVDGLLSTTEVWIIYSDNKRIRIK